MLDAWIAGVEGLLQVKELMFLSLGMAIGLLFGALPGLGGATALALVSKGATPQRLLWASTSTKDPTFSPVKYVDEIIAPETVNTMPRETIAAYRTQGKPEVRIEGEIAVSFKTLTRPSRTFARFSGVNCVVTIAVRSISTMRSNSSARPCIVIVNES